MTDYSKADHQTLYNYVQSGDPNAMHDTAQAWKNHSTQLQDATQQLQTNLTAIQSQWQGAAADAYFQQSQTVANKMQTHADNAANTSVAVTNTANALSWARNNMPSPPSWLEQQAANIDSNWGTGIAAGILTGGEANIASEIAKHDIAQKHQQAVSTMTQLASAYGSAQQQLPTSGFSSIDDPTNNNGNNPPGSNPAPIMPVPIYPISPGNPGNPGNPGHYPGGPGSTSHNPGTYPGTNPGGYPTNTPPSEKVPAMTPPGGSTSIQGLGGTGGTSGYGTGSSPYTPGSGELGGGLGSGSGGGIGGAGLGGAGTGLAGGLGGAGAGFGGGLGSGAYGSGKKGGTTLGAGEGSGLGSGEGSGSGAGSRYGASGAGAEGEGAVGAGAQGQQGMMGGAGSRGAGGGKGEERGNRAGFLRQDPDYWYGDKQAAPPGGVIE